MTQTTDDTTKQLIEDLRIALGHWVHRYAPDCCEREAVEKVLRDLQDNGGTLGYIARLNRRIKDWQVNHADHMTFVDGTEVTQDGFVMPACGEKKTIPSIHMPRWACRTMVKITEIRVQRLQEISAEDVMAEGVDCSDEPETHDIYLQRWRHLWTSINGADSWNANPWVWVLTFKKV